MRVLVVEDDVGMAAAIVRALRTARVLADVAATVSAARTMIADATYDVVVLDVMLPDGVGFDLCRRWRDEGVWTPVIMLTARADVEDRVKGLDAGADDYLTKPFALGELLARLRALSRREVSCRPSVCWVGDLRLEPAAAQLWRGEVEISLSAREFALMDALMRSPGQVLSHVQLLDAA